MVSIDYSEIISKSWKLTLKLKWLWVYGLVIATMTGSSFGNGFGGGGGSGKSTPSPAWPTPHPIQSPGYLGDKVTSVLGDSTTALKEWVSHISPATWALLTIAIILVVLVSLIVRFIIMSWAQAALIGAWKEGLSGKEATLRSTSIYGLKYWKQVLKFRILLTIVVFAIIFVAMMVFGILAGIFAISGLKTVGMILLAILAIPFAILFFVGIIFSALTSVYAERLIVLHDMRPKAALKKAFSLSKGSFFQSIIMGFIKSFIQMSVGCLGTVTLLIAVGVPSLIVGLIEFGGGWHMPGVPTVVIWIILLTIFWQMSLLLRAGLTVFGFGVWNQFVESVMKGEKKI